MKTYIIHATCRYVVQHKETGETYSAQNRPTISIEASSEKAAINKATKQQKKAIGTDWWPCVSFSLIPELVTVIEHSTAAQLRVLRRFGDGPSSAVGTRTDQGMISRLVDKGWLEGSTKAGYMLTAAGRREVGI